MAHNTLTNGEIHKCHDNSYSDRASLLGVTTASADIGKIYKVEDEDAYYICKSAGSPGTFLVAGNTEVTKTSTTNDTVTDLWTYTMADNSRIIVEATVLAMETDGTNGNGYKVRGLFKREAAGVATQQGSTIAVWTEEEDAAWACALAVDGGNVVSVTGTGGAATTNVTWISEVKLTHVI